MSSHPLAAKYNIIILCIYSTTATNNNNNYEITPPPKRCCNTTTKGTRLGEKGLFLKRGCGLLLVSNPFFGSPVRRGTRVINFYGSRRANLISRRRQCFPRLETRIFRFFLFSKIIILNYYHCYCCCGRYGRYRGGGIKHVYYT